MKIKEIIKLVRTGILQIRLEKAGDLISTGTGFLVEGGIATNSHVVRGDETHDTVILRFEDQDPGGQEVIKMSAKDIFKMIAAESPKELDDYAYIKIKEPEFARRYVFEFVEHELFAAGDKVLFLGFPFSMHQLTAHVGYISSIHTHKTILRIQIDGSVNGGNSGGPLINIEEGKVGGIITRAYTGIIQEQFENLIRTLRQNQQILERAQGGVSIGGIDPNEALRASQAAMEQIAINLFRTANVGIGFAYSTNPISEQVRNK